MQELMADPRVTTVISDQCEYGLTALTDDGRRLPAKKPTKWATSSKHMAQRLSTRCSGLHSHQHLMGGRAAEAAFYPQELIVEILRGIRDTADAESKDLDDVIPAHLSTLMSTAEQLHDVPRVPVLAAIQEADATKKSFDHITKLNYSDGSSREINLDD